jgi:hypothetical protein
MAASASNRVADDYREGIGPVTEELYGEDTQPNRQKVYHQLRQPPEKRLKGLFKVSPRRVALVPSEARADLARRSNPVAPNP